MFNWHASLSPFGSWHNGENPFSPSGLLVNSTAFLWYDPSDVANTLWRRNLLTWTEQFDNAAWNTATVTVAVDQTSAPNGTATADRITKGATAFQSVFRTGVVSVAGQTYTVSAYFKSDTLTRASIAAISGTSDVRYWFDLSAKTVGGAIGSFTTGYVGSAIEDVGNGWLRCSLTVTAQASQVATYFYPDKADNAVAGSVFLWGAQLEVGSTATEYQRITDVNTEVIALFPTATLYQDAAGTTPVTAPAQPVGLVLDKSQGLVLGPELVTNGDFSSGTTGWSAGNSSTISVTSGVAQVAQTSSNLADIRQTITTVAGRTYRVSCEIASQNAASIVAVAQDTSTFAVIQQSVAVTSATVTTVSFVFTANAATTRIAVRFNASGASGNTFTTDNISVRELPGFHATQSTAASRPTYGVVPSRGRVNLLTRTAFDGAAAGTPGTAPTDWPFNSSGGSITSASGGVIGFSVTAARQIIGQVVTVAASQTQTWSVRVVSNQNGLVSNQLFAVINPTGLLTLDYFANGAPINAVTYVPQSGDVLSARLVNAASPITPTFRIGVGASGVATGAASFTEPQAELGSTATPYQRVVSQFDVTDPVGFPSYPCHYLFFDGIDDFLQTATITPNADKAQVFAGVRKLSDAAESVLIELSTNSFANFGTFAIWGNQPTATTGIRVRTGGTLFATADGVFGASPRTGVLSFTGDISGDLATLRVNGTQAAQSTTDQGAGNYLAYPLFIGRRGGASLAFNGQLYGLIVRFSGANLDASLISQTEQWVGGKTGVTIA